jgi:hypothetical protein
MNKYLSLISLKIEGPHRGWELSKILHSDYRKQRGEMPDPLNLNLAPRRTLMQLLLEEGAEELPSYTESQDKEWREIRYLRLLGRWYRETKDMQLSHAAFRSARSRVRSLRVGRDAFAPLFVRGTDGSLEILDVRRAVRR